MLPDALAAGDPPCMFPYSKNPYMAWDLQFSNLQSSCWIMHGANTWVQIIDFFTDFQSNMVVQTFWMPPACTSLSLLLVLCACQGKYFAHVFLMLYVRLKLTEQRLNTLDLRITFTTKSRQKSRVS